MKFRTSSYASIPSSSNNSTSTSSSSHIETTLSVPLIPCGRAKLTDCTAVTEALTSKIYTELHWANLTHLKELSTRENWDGWFPHNNMTGDILYRWVPKHDDLKRRSHLNKSIYLLKLGDYVVPVLEDGVCVLSDIDT